MSNNVSESAVTLHRVQPFQVRKVRERSFFSRVFGGSRPADAEAAIENLIAQRGLDNVDVVAIDNCLHQYGVRDEAVKPLLLQIWRHAVERLVATDGSLDDLEAAFLDRLKEVLGLGEVEANNERDSILITNFMDRARPLISRLDAQSDQTRSRISRVQEVDDLAGRIAASYPRLGVRDTVAGRQIIHTTFVSVVAYLARIGVPITKPTFAFWKCIENFLAIDSGAAPSSIEKIREFFNRVTEAKTPLALNNLALSDLCLLPALQQYDAEHGTKFAERARMLIWRFAASFVGVDGESTLDEESALDEFRQALDGSTAWTLSQGNRDDRAVHVSQEMAEIGKPFDQKLAIA